MKADFSGYATRAGLKCSDGRTITPDAFKHQDGETVPLVWQHGHTDPENVLGHAVLEHREDGVYAYAFFNKSPKAVHSATLVEHKDITMLSIWANQLIERGGNVLHGAIREVSLVLSGANPGAKIETVTIQHSDGESVDIEDEAIIYSGQPLVIEHDNLEDSDDASEDEVKVDETVVDEPIAHADTDVDEETIQDIYEGMSEKEKEVVHYMIGQVLKADKKEDSADEETDGEVKQDNIDEDTDLAHSGDDDEPNNTLSEGNEMTHNVFENTGEAEGPTTLSHDQMKEIVGNAQRGGSLRDAVDTFALAHGITDIDTLFPDAQMTGNTPEWLKRRTEWVDMFLGATSKSPFSRVKTMYADITEDDARAKGYITGSLKKEEFFSVAKRVTTPTTIYKKQKIDRDDMIDITDFDVVSWLKAEMRLMLDEEVARAALLGDGRDIASDDKVNEGNIRPIASDHELYTVTINVNVDDASSSAQEIIDAIIMSRSKYKGTGRPYFFTTETTIAQFLLLKDTTGRRIYKSLEEVASDLRVQAVVPVEVMEEVTDIVGIIVNPIDYRFGADAGGQVTMFDDFDIDYNQQKYLIETRFSGALAKLKSAMVVKKVASTDVLVAPVKPAFDPATGALSIVDVTGVIYKDELDAVKTEIGSPYTVASGASTTITATPDTNYYFATSEDDSWTFTAEDY